MPGLPDPFSMHVVPLLTDKEGGHLSHPMAGSTGEDHNSGLLIIFIEFLVTKLAELLKADPCSDISQLMKNKPVKHPPPMVSSGCGVTWGFRMKHAVSPVDQEQTQIVSKRRIVICTALPPDPKVSAASHLEEVYQQLQTTSPRRACSNSVLQTPSSQQPRPKVQSHVLGSTLKLTAFGVTHLVGSE